MPDKAKKWQYIDNCDVLFECHLIVFRKIYNIKYFKINCNEN